MRILFISHETTRTGAPLVLLYFLRWLHLHKPDVEVSVLSLKEGDLNQDFVDLCTNFYNYEILIKPAKLTILQRFFVKLKFKKIKNKESILFQKIEDKKFDIVYSNTIKSIAIGTKIKSNSPEIKHIAHIHELNVIIRHLLPNFQDYLYAINHIIVPSDLTKQNLITYWNVPQKQISHVYAFSEIKLSPTKLTNKESIFHIGGSGTVHWRKGYDVFIQVARYINTKYPEKRVLFTWVGKLYELEKLIIEEDLRKLNLSDVVKFIGEVDDSTILYNDFDVFLMTSREDPFPLVCIEVGMLGKPIISFEQATGTNAIIAKGGGFIVPYQDIEAMAEKVIYYIENPKERLEHGNINAVEFSNFTPDNVCPQLFLIINEQMQ